MREPLRVTLLDNIDSFTFNLVDEFARRGARVTVFRNDRPAAEILAHAAEPGPRLLVVSPGPGNPAGAGSAVAAIAGGLGRVPVFGVCLGHQALVVALGGLVGLAPAPLHGRATPLRHQGTGIFAGLPSPMPVARYHSLAATTVPDGLDSIAESDGVVMAVSHRTLAAIGVQFHPESVHTPHGGRLIDHVIAWAHHASH